MLSEPEKKYDILISLVLNIPCFFVLTAFLYSFIRHSNKSYASLMIIILTLSYILYPFINIYTTFYIKDRLPTETEASIDVAINIFNLYWTAAFALFTYIVADSIISLKAFNFKLFFWIIFLISLLASLLFPLM